MRQSSSHVAFLFHNPVLNMGSSPRGSGTLVPACCSKKASGQTRPIAAIRPPQAYFSGTCFDHHKEKEKKQTSNAVYAPSAEGEAWCRMTAARLLTSRQLAARISVKGQGKRLQHRAGFLWGLCNESRSLRKPVNPLRSITGMMGSTGGQLLASFGRQKVPTCTVRLATFLVAV
jgi:hypothetical protein